MKKTWSLKELYPSFESNEFKEDLNKVSGLIKEINNWVNKKIPAKENKEDIIIKYLEYSQSFRSLYTKLMAFAQLSLSTDADNEKAAKSIEILKNKNTELTKSRVKFSKWLGSFDHLTNFIDNSEKKIIKEHKFYLTEKAEKSEFLLTENEEKIIAKMANTGSEAWNKLQQKLTSSLLVDIKIEGEKKQLPLPEVRNMAYEGEPELRKKAYHAEIESYKKIEKPVAAALNGIKGEVITRCKEKGYNSPLHKTLFESRVDKKTLDSLLKVIEEYLPIFHKYYLKKAKILGHNNGLPFYDLFAPLGKKTLKFTYKKARDFIVNNFKDFNQELADFVDKAFTERWIDAKPREGKRGGAFCYNLHPINQSRILANFNGSFSNVSTLAHELGHAFHGYCLQKESILNTNYPMPLAETASIFNETIITRAAINKADREETYSILENSISSAGQVIVDIFSRFQFEKDLFAKRKESSLTVEELKNLMIKAQKKAYGNSLNHNYLHPYMWICKPHYYNADNNYYNFPYAFGLLFGKGVYAQYEKNPESFWTKYKKLLAATGKNKVKNVADMLDIDLHSPDFWRSSLGIIKKDINEFLEM